MNGSSFVFVSLIIATILSAVFYYARNNYYKGRGQDVPYTKNGFSIKYHYFVWYFLIPLLVVFWLLDYASSIETLNYFPYNLLLSVDFVDAVLLIVSFIGFFKYAKYAWSCLICAFVSNAIVFSVVYILSIFNNGQIDWVSLIGVIVIRILFIRVLTIVYYYKRRSLFTYQKKAKKDDYAKSSENLNEIVNEKTPSEASFKSMIQLETDQTRYCEVCGEIITGGSLFCRRCGTRVNEQVAKKCNDCGRILSGKNLYCEYCGSSNIEDYIETAAIKTNARKKCANCGKELPDDSVFCQYCGSKTLINIEMPDPSKGQSINMRLNPNERIEVNANIYQDTGINNTIKETNKQNCAIEIDINNDASFQQCKYCGYKLYPGTEVCLNCKRRVSDGKKVGLPTPITHYIYEDEPVKQRTSINKKKIILFLSTIIVLLVLLFPVCFKSIVKRVIIPNQNVYIDFHLTNDTFVINDDSTNIVIYARGYNSINYTFIGLGVDVDYNETLSSNNYYCWTIERNKLGFGIVIFSNDKNDKEIKLYVGN